MTAKTMAELRTAQPAVLPIASTDLVTITRDGVNLTPCTVAELAIAILGQLNPETHLVSAFTLGTPLTLSHPALLGLVLIDGINSTDGSATLNVAKTEVTLSLGFDTTAATKITVL
jgi:hypothetical protein